ncbi:hypothetical protein HHK36_032679 [Tetracentron sinense]|uniref:Uncharacterized protein n=1 Tax=Tetracentron sinense TaxID=13715 RepID=A0A834Y545_TETSI|nr:hypothetical protein HHK36_032679 [Tetracentron sinense]
MTPPYGPAKLLEIVGEQHASMIHGLADLEIVEEQHASMIQWQAFIGKHVQYCSNEFLSWLWRDAKEGNAISKIYEERLVIGGYSASAIPDLDSDLHLSDFINFANNHGDLGGWLRHLRFQQRSTHKPFLIGILMQSSALGYLASAIPNLDSDAVIFICSVLPSISVH